MACPFFYPGEPLASAPGELLPLGDAYDGECRAPAAVAAKSAPAPDIIRELCNLGYARGRCPHFDGVHPSDANRFAVSADSGGRVVIQFVEERDHRPGRHGSLEYDPASAGFSTAGLEPTLDRQARAYLRAYLRRKPRS